MSIPNMSIVLLDCRSTANDHVKDSLPAWLQRIRTFAKLRPLEKWRDLISPEEMEHCIQAKTKLRTYYPVTIEVFVSFLYKVSPYHII